MKHKLFELWKEYEGSRPEISKINIETLNKDIILGYLSDKISPALLTVLNKELET